MATNLGREDSIDEKAAKAGILTSHGIELDIASTADGVRPPNIRHMYGQRDPKSPVLVID